MKNLLFNFDKLTEKDPGVNRATQQFHRAGASVVQADPGSGVKRTSGVSYRELSLTFADSQRVVLRIKQSGDIYQVALNGNIIPIKNQDDHAAAIAEITKVMDASRVKFQRKLAATKVKPPASIRTAAPKMEAVLTQRRDALKEAVAEVRSEIERVRATIPAATPAAMDSATLDAAKPKAGFMAFKVDAFKRFTVYVKFEAGMTEQDARRDALSVVKAELGGGAVRILSDDGVLVSKVPADASEVAKAKGWAWIASRT